MKSATTKSSRRTRRQRSRPVKGATQGDGPAYAGQVSAVFTLPGLTALSTTTVTTGVIADVITISSGLVNGFATRFGSTFDEYRILGANVKIRPLAASQGITAFWFDEKSSAAPTANDSSARTTMKLPNTSSTPVSFKTMTWRARDLLDLEYSAIGSTPTPVYFKVYTSNAVYGAPITATSLWIFEIDLIVEFRGLKSA